MLLRRLVCLAVCLVLCLLLPGAAGAELALSGTSPAQAALSAYLAEVNALLQAQGQPVLNSVFIDTLNMAVVGATAEAGAEVPEDAGAQTALLEKLSGEKAPASLAGVLEREVRFNDVIDPNDMMQYVLGKAARA